MILDELYRRYARLRDAGELPAFGYSVEKVTGAVVLYPDGDVRVRDMRRQAPGKGKSAKPVLRPAQVTVPQPPRRTVKVLPGFLCDTAGYLFGLAEDGKQARGLECFEASRNRHEAVLAGIDHPAASAVLAFFRSWTPGAIPPDTDPNLLSGWLYLELAGEGPIHAVPEIRAAWEKAAGGDEEVPVGQCLVTGEEGVPIARIHPAVKGVPGAQTAGAALVSFNGAAYESYGRTQNYNAPVSLAAAHGYTAALNDLLGRRGERHLVIGDVSIVFWTDRPSVMEEDFGLALTAAPPARAEDEDVVRGLQERLARIARGRAAYPLAEHATPFFVLGLSPNAARLSVRFWAQGTLGEMADRVAQHLADIDLVTEWPWEMRHPSIRLLADETRIKYGRTAKEARPDPNDKGLAKLQGDLLRAVLTGGAYPLSLLSVLLDRMRADHVVNHRRMALVKAVLLRRARLAGGTGHEERDCLVSLDENRTDAGYLLGCLFALLERLQQQAADGRELNATIRDKYIGSASATPRNVFPHLLRLAQAHLKRVRNTPKSTTGHFIDSRIERIQNTLTDYPATLGLEQRGLFFLGYYHQRRALWTKRAPDGEAGADAEAMTDIDNDTVPEPDAAE